MSHTAIDFVLQFDEMLDHLDRTMNSKYRITILRFRYLDPHDLVNPETVFMSKKEMIIHLRKCIMIDYMWNYPDQWN